MQISRIQAHDSRHRHKTPNIIAPLVRHTTRSASRRKRRNHIATYSGYARVGLPEPTFVSIISPPRAPTKFCVRISFEVPLKSSTSLPVSAHRRKPIQQNQMKSSGPASRPRSTCIAFSRRSMALPASCGSNCRKPKSPFSPNCKSGSLSNRQLTSLVKGASSNSLDKST